MRTQGAFYALPPPPPPVTNKFNKIKYDENNCPKIMKQKQITQINQNMNNRLQ